jgi:hypothetical protein
MADTFDWNIKTDTLEGKDAFHRAAKKQLNRLAKEMGFAAGSFDLRSNKAGMATSGEIILQSEHIYIHASKPATSSVDRGLMIRTVEGRGVDARSGNNHYAPLSWLDDENRPKLRKLVTQIMEQKLGFDADGRDPSYHPVYSTPRHSM